LIWGILFVHRYTAIKLKARKINTIIQEKQNVIISLIKAGKAAKRAPDKVQFQAPIVPFPPVY